MLEINEDYINSFFTKESELEIIRRNICNKAIQIGKDIGYKFEYDTFDEYYSDSWFEIRNNINDTKKIFYIHLNYYKYQDSQQDSCCFDLSYFWIPNYIEIENKLKEERLLKKKQEEDLLKKLEKEKEDRIEYEQYLYLKNKYEKH